MGAAGVGRDSFVGPRSGRRAGRGTPMDSAMVDAMRTMKVSFIWRRVYSSYVQTYDELTYMRRRKEGAPWIKYVEKVLALAQQIRWDLFLTAPHFPNSVLLLIEA